MSYLRQQGKGEKRWW